MNWQPIETAPKDETRIIVALIDDGNIFEAQGGFIEHVPEDECFECGYSHYKVLERVAGYYFCYYFNEKELETAWNIDHDFYFTHWMPLPEPLKEDEK